jgi:hypothetical protein
MPCQLSHTPADDPAEETAELQAEVARGRVDNTAGSSSDVPFAMRRSAAVAACTEVSWPRSCWRAHIIATHPATAMPATQISSRAAASHSPSA